MKKNTLVLSLFCLLVFNSCGPAAENREAMHVRAKAFQDSIALIIKTSMDEAAAPGPGQQVAPTPTAAPTTSAAATK
ncbi:MAG: hypothetical protein V4635_05255 [Bacteroidota bacterium]